MFKKAAVAVVAALCLAPVVGQAASAQSTPALDKNGVVRAGFAGSLQTWDPVTALTPGIAEVLFPPVYDRLVFRNGTGEGAAGLSPMLATSWSTTPDGMSTTFKLRKGVKFQDGQPLTAAGVRGNFQRDISFPGSVAAPVFSNVKSMEVLDDLTIKFNLKTKSFTLPNTMAASSAWVLSPKVSKIAGIKAPAGSGPYKHVPAESTATKQVYVPNPSYWGMDQPFAPKLKRLEILTLADDTARFNAFRSGQVDLAVSRISQHDAAKKLVGNRAGTKLFSTPSKNGSFVQVNSSSGPLKNPLVRQALNLAIDRNAINQALLSGSGTITDQMFMKGAPGYIPSHAVPKYDLAKAKALLARSGEGSFDLQLVTYANQPPSTLIAQALQAAWSKLGVNVNINLLANGVAQPEWIKGKYDLFSTTIPYQGDPETTLADGLLGSRFIGKTPAALDKLIDTASGFNLGTAQRDQAFQKVNQYMIDNALEFSIASFPTEYVGKANIWNADKMPTSNQSTTFSATVLGILK